MTAESGYSRQLGTFAFEKLAGADRNPDFVAILAQEATVDLDAADGQQTPRYLTNFPNLLEGVKKLHLKADLQPGAYRVTYGFLDCGMPSTVHSIDWTGGYASAEQMFFEATCDGRRIGGFMNRPPKAMPVFDDRVVTMAFDFLVEKPGEHRIAINAFTPEEFRNITTGAVQVAFVGYRIESIPLACVNSFDDEIPGQVALDLWGWHTPISYERSHINAYAMDVKYYKERVVDEQYKWGANIVEIYCPADAVDSGTIFTNSVPWPFDHNDPGSTCYRFNPFLAWSEEDFQEAVDYAHGKGMLLHLFNHYADDIELSPLGEDGNLSLDVNPYQKMLNTIWWVRAFAVRMLQSWGDARGRSWSRVVDGLGYEGQWIGVSEDAGAINKGLTDDAWEYNPGLYMMASTGRVPRPPWTPAMLLYYACSGIGGGFKCGADDLTALPYEPDVYCHRRNGHGKYFMINQTDIRMMRRFPNKGGTHPDWIMKQGYDFFRPRKTNPNDIHHSSIVWINEELGRPHIRLYVYGISQDPLRSAVAGYFTTTGEGGRFHAKSTSRMTSVRGGGAATGHYDLQPRRHFPQHTNFLRNNVLELLLFPKDEGGILRVDLQGLGHYDDNSMSVDLLDNFMETTQIIDGERLGGRTKFGKPRGLHEYAGYKACVEEYVRVGRLRKPFEEFRRYTLLNDSPIINLRITRKDPDPIGALETRLGCPAGAKLFVDGKPVEGSREWDACPPPLVFRRADGLAEGLALIFSEISNLANVRYDADARVVVVTTAPAAAGVVEANWILLHGRYTEADIPALVADAKSLEVPVELSDNKATISSSSSLPIVKVARVSNPSDGPYMVCEKGWWLFRGAQPSRELPGLDYVKVYLTPGETVELISYGFIDDLVRPGWGCQYMVALRDITATEGGCRFKVRVLSQTPHLFAPRIQMKQTIAAVEMDGKSWHYFEDDMVFFPQDLGDHEVVVKFGKPEAPFLTRTFGNVQSTAWDGDTFSAEVRPPYDATNLWEAIQLHAIIKPPEGGSIEPTERVEGVETDGRFINIAYRPDGFALGLRVT